jgi:hypothetical protein
MYAPRAKFERIYIVSPIKVAIIFLTSLQCLFLLITLLTSFWIETKLARYGPLFSCKKQCIWENSQNASWTFQCSLGGFIYDRNLFRISLTAILIILSLVLSILSIVTGNFSFIKTSSSIRHRYWLCTILLLLFICLIDCFILVCIPLSYHHQIYQFQWAYGLHCSGTLFISVSLIVAILTHHTDDVRYIERIEK